MPGSGAERSAHDAPGGRTVIAIVGPTASGKSTLALLLAGLLPCEIISADSRQVYDGMAIGTAQPLPADLARVPHHFVAELPPDREFDAGRFGVLGRRIIGEIFRRGRVPLVAGGSGLYLRSLLRGLFEGPGAERAVRGVLEERLLAAGPEALLSELRAIDPDAAAQLHPSDARRIIRALEVHALTGKTITELHRAKPEIPFGVCQAGLRWKREALYGRINARTIAMVNGGLVEETRRLLDLGYPTTLRSLQTVGYREAIAHIGGKLTREEMISVIQMNTRRFAKRQLTWFRADPSIRWFDVSGEGDFPAIAAELAAVSGSARRAGPPPRGRAF